LFDHHRPPVIKQTVQVMIACQRLNDRYASVRAAIATVSLAIKPPTLLTNFSAFVTMFEPKRAAK
jgi:hypothetical protein